MLRRADSIAFWMAKGTSRALPTETYSTVAVTDRC